MDISTIGIIWFGGHRIESGAMPIGNLTAFLSYIMEIMISVTIAMSMFIMVPRAEASAERILEVLNTKPSIQDPPKPVVPRNIKGHVEFCDVEFCYPGRRPVLRDISFIATPGKTSHHREHRMRKSTLVNLIPRFYDVTGGSIKIDGTDIRDMLLRDLRARIGLVPQRSFLFQRNHS